MKSVTVKIPDNEKENLSAFVKDRGGEIVGQKIPATKVTLPKTKTTMK